MTETNLHPYTPARPPLTESSHELRARIPGWGVDLDPNDRPSVPKLQLRTDLSEAQDEFPERQPESWPRERSIEHRFLTPVFGTSCPPKGLSGRIRRLAYAKYSEGRAAHWLLLLGADRVDAVESALGSFLTLRPDNPITQTGVLSEFRRHGLSSRLGQKRTDTVHHPIDPVIVGAPWVLGGAMAYRAYRAWRRARTGQAQP